MAGKSVQENVTRQNLVEELFDWTVPVEAVPLPSEGKVYSPDSPLHSKSLVEIKAMTAQEEDILSSPALIRQGTVITQLIKSCIIDKKINVDNMLLGDRNAIMISIRVTGYGSDYPADITCPACGKKSEQEFNLSDLEINRLDIDPVLPGQNLFAYKLPVTGKVVHFKFLTGVDENDRSTLLERTKKITGGSGIEKNITTRLEYHIVSIEGVEDRNTISQFVSKMPALDSKNLRSYISDNEPGIDMTADIHCPDCGHEGRVGLPMGATFFWPN
tara:strand:- start:13690 stop:14508 length:819 start_codon:yes stop_codon:yes gene_type:complete